MEIWQVIEQIAQYPDSDKLQARFDLLKERIYELAGVWIASLHPETVLNTQSDYGTLDCILSKAGIKVFSMSSKGHSKQMFKEMGIKYLNKNIETDKIDDYDVAILELDKLNYNPLPVLRKLRKSCKAVFLTTPAKEVHYECMGRWCDEVNWRQIPQYDKYEYKEGTHHIYYLWEIRDLLREAGFSIRESQLLPVEATWGVLAI